MPWVFSIFSSEAFYNTHMFSLLEGAWEFRHPLSLNPKLLSDMLDAIYWCFVLFVFSVFYGIVSHFFEAINTYPPSF